ncbi:MAG: gliding motility-associated C-terminal domain-containing protein [Bacteroidia bacterium]
MHTIRLNIIDGGCWSNTYLAPVMVKKMPVSNFVASEIVVCNPALISFSNLSDNEGNQMTYNWEFGNGRSSVQENPTIMFSEPGNFDVALNITGINGCFNQYEIPQMIRVNQTPDAAFEATPTYTTFVDPEIYITDLSSYATECVYSMGNGDSVFTFDHVYIYPDTGTYTITQILHNEAGCYDTAFATVRVDFGFKVYIPSAFTPNDDGLNDLFMVEGEDFENFSMMIYNRWGQLLYNSFDPENGWDGKTKLSNQPVPGGVYVYTIKLTSKFGVPYTYRGEVTVLR